MTVFNCPTRNAEDLKVLLIGVVCSLVIFTVFTAYEEVSSALMIVDLVHFR